MFHYTGVQTRLSTETFSRDFQLKPLTSTINLDFQPQHFTLVQVKSGVMYATRPNH